MTSAIKRVIVIVNTIGFVAYLVWLMQFTTGETMRSQDGIFTTFLPAVFICLHAPGAPKPASKEHPTLQAIPCPAAPADKDTSEASKP